LFVSLPAVQVVNGTLGVRGCREGDRKGGTITRRLHRWHFQLFPQGRRFGTLMGCGSWCCKLASGEAVAKAFDARSPEDRRFPISSIDHNATVPLSEAEFRADFERLTSSKAAP
jgi:hypothetical protein